MMVIGGNEGMADRRCQRRLCDVGGVGADGGGAGADGGGDL